VNVGFGYDKCWCWKGKMYLINTSMMRSRKRHIIIFYHNDIIITEVMLSNIIETMWNWGFGIVSDVWNCS